MLLEKIIKGIQLVKGENVSIINLKCKNNFICDYFIICNGNSKNQVDAIYKSVERVTKNELKIKPWHIEGLKNKEWILVDYVTVVVHIFIEEKRFYYDIENLWKSSKYIVKK
ncbi:ribosome silencing factor [Blattabacterium cuenoti]|uniref:ribosome silencing factor n=1 Tax=Blattabacterium cuenoti TaxID=1653831 RepID=UPI00163BD26D|nr:ribosome silencing factor [Blattabacterium cuenoti]